MSKTNIDEHQSASEIFKQTTKVGVEHTHRENQAKQLCCRPDVDPGFREHLRQQVAAHGDCEVIEYKVKYKAKTFRGYASTPSLQRIEKPVRRWLTAGLYSDLDIKNCLPSLTTATSPELTKVLAYYCEHREQILADLEKNINFKQDVGQDTPKVS